MPAWSFLEIGVLVSALVGAAGLGLSLRRTAAFGRREPFARAAGKAGEGVRFFFTAGMLPRHKESARDHALVYLAGVLYHGGIFLALLGLFLGLFRVPVPAVAARAAGWVVLAALAAGLGLLVKRVVTPGTRRLSVPDDFLSNFLVDLFLAGCLLASVDPAWGTPAGIAAIVLFLYAPLGKIRHCAYFFVSRLTLGAFFGRRGVYPPKPSPAPGPQVNP
ncbi:MAG: hypothetical protein KA419_01540 [Acidobacteria bacterium]|nr:hypothetical protein [Acidobacteriota bacterium]